MVIKNEFGFYKDASGKSFTIERLTTLEDLVLPEELNIFDLKGEKAFFIIHIRELFKQHLRMLSIKGLTLNCNSRTGGFGDVCCLENHGLSNSRYLVFYAPTFYADNTCLITIDRIISARGESCCNYY